MSIAIKVAVEVAFRVAIDFANVAHYRDKGLKKTKNMAKSVKFV
jgi:hypothetical protein